MSDNNKKIIGVLLHRQMADAVRTWQIIAIFLAICLIVSIVANMLLVPLKETKVKYVEFSSSADNFFTVYPSNMPSETKTLLIRKALRNYVWNRTRKDSITEVSRFAQVKAMSAPEVFEEFKNEYHKTIDALKDIDRDVEVISDSPIDDNIHQIEFKTIDNKAGDIKVNSYMATIRYGLQKQLTNDDMALNNPFGVIVVKYSISKRKGGSSQ